MDEKKQGLSLLDKLKDSKAAPEAALLTTFNAYLPFFEELVLRRLHATGCRHVVLAMDARQMAQELGAEERRPRRAGTGYTLVPVAAQGSFHPKLLLLAGRKGGRLCVGSHNLTYAGYGHNRELTNEILVEDAKDRAGAGLFRDALSFVRAWAETQPPSVRESIEAVARFAPWITGPVPVDVPERFVGSLPRGPSLWDSVRPLLPEGVRRVTVVGPFFDPGLAFLRRLQQDLHPAEVVVGVEPARVVLDANVAERWQGTTFVNVGALGTLRGDAGHYLHAKALLFETSRETVLITGSANPTAAAWLAPPGQRNAEAVLVRSGREAERLSSELGLLGLAGAPRLDGSTWNSVRQQQMERAKDEGVSTSVTAALYFEEAPEGFVTDAEPLSNRIIQEVELLDVDGLVRLRLPPPDVAPPFRLHIVDEDVRAAAAFVRLRCADGQTLWGVVHRTRMLREMAVPGAQRELRTALGALGDDPTQFENLFRIVERVIFAEETTPTSSGAAGRTQDDNAPLDAPSEAPLGVSLSQVQASTSSRRRLSKGDLALLLDALLRRLGEGLESNDSPSRPQRNDEDLIGTEDDPDEPGLPLEKVERLAQLCRGKTRTLLSRLSRQMGKPEKSADTLILQAAAVLGLLRSLRHVEQREPWKSAKEQLLDAECLKKFFFPMLHKFLAPGGLLDRALEGAGGEFAEASALRELLGWAAWDTELELASCVGTAEWSAEEQASHNSQLALLATALAGDAQAASTLAENLGRTPRRGVVHRNWLDALLLFGTAILRATQSPAAIARLARPVMPGDMVVATKTQRVALVLAVRDGKKVILSGFKLALRRDEVEGLDWRAAAASRVHSA